MTQAATPDAIALVPEDEFDVDAVRREWCGRSLGRSVGRYPVEHDPIRRYCHMTGERTPVSLDPEAAARSPWGRVVCPPTFVRYFVGRGWWPPGDTPEPNSTPTAVPRLGDRGVNLETRWEFHRPVLVGDHLSATWTVDDVFEKPTRLDPRSVWILTSAVIEDDAAGTVAVWRNTVLFHRPADTATTTPTPTSSGPHPVPDDAVVAFTMDLTPTAAVLQVSGSQDWNLVHHDPAYARDSGHDSTFFNTGWTQGLLGRIVTEFIGDRPWRLADLRFRMQRMARPGDRVTAWYRPPDERADEDLHLEIGLATDRAGVTTTAAATVRRDPGVPR